MPAHVNPQARLTVSFWRAEECHDARVARDGVHAVLVTMALLADLGQLQHGDRLIVSEDPGEDTLPEASRSSHMGG